MKKTFRLFKWRICLKIDVQKVGIMTINIPNNANDCHVRSGFFTNGSFLYGDYIPISPKFRYYVGNNPIDIRIPPCKSANIVKLTPRYSTDTGKRVNNTDRSVIIEYLKN